MLSCEMDCGALLGKICNDLIDLEQDPFVQEAEFLEFLELEDFQCGDIFLTDLDPESHVSMPYQLQFELRKSLFARIEESADRGLSLFTLFHRMSFFLNKTYKEVYETMGLDKDKLDHMLVEYPNEEEIKLGAQEILKIQWFFFLSRDQMKSILLATYFEVYPPEDRMVGYGVFEDDEEWRECFSGEIEEVVARIIKHLIII